jgi:hypothetical protein
MNITFSLNSNPALFRAFNRAIEHICDGNPIRSQDTVIDLLQQKCGVRLIRDGGDHTGTTRWTAHFVDDITYAWFLLRWS